MGISGADGVGLFRPDAGDIRGLFFRSVIGAPFSQSDNNHIAGFFVQDTGRFLDGRSSSVFQRLRLIQMQDGREREDPRENLRRENLDSRPRSKIDPEIRVLFQKTDDMRAGALFDFQTADVDAVDGVCVGQIEPFRTEAVFRAPVTDECTFSLGFHKAVAAAVFLFRRRDGAFYPFLGQRFPDEMPVCACPDG